MIDVDISPRIDYFKKLAVPHADILDDELQKKNIVKLNL